MNESEGAFHYTGPIGQRPLGLIKETGTKTPTELIVGYCRKGKGHILPREKRGKTSSKYREASNILVFKN